MSRPLLDVFPAEIRDQIFRYVLASPSGLVTLTPWTVDVAQSLTLLRTCRQIHAECKAIIWHDNGLSIRYPSQLSQHIRSLSKLQHTRRIQHVRISLELMDRDELEWAKTALDTFATWPRLKSVTFTAAWDKPRGVEEFREELELRSLGQPLDGRLYKDRMTGTIMLVNTGWPRFSHWGKQKWLRAMLLDPTRIQELLKEVHETLGGELWVDRVLCFKGQKAVNNVDFDPRDGEIRMILGRPSTSSKA